MSMNGLCEAVAANLASIPDTQKSAYFQPSPIYPILQVVPGGIQYDQAMHRGLDIVTLTVQARVDLNENLSSQKKLHRFLENGTDYSVKDAIESDRTLGGLCDDLHVSEASGVQLMVPASGGAELIIEWTVMVYGTGTL